MSTWRNFTLVLVLILTLAVCNQGQLMRKLRLKLPLADVTGTVMDFTQELLLYTVEEFLMFDVFKKTFNKTYSSPTKEKRSMLNFLFNQRAATTHNSNYAAGLVSFSVSLYAYSDMPSKDVSTILNGFRLPVLPRLAQDEEVNFVPPKSLNWVTKGFVTKVKNQDLCGSCWSFSAIGALEGQHFKKTGKLMEFSQQNLIDCNYDEEFGNYGCNGGDMITAFKFLMNQTGTALESNYAYKASHSSKCNYKQSQLGVVTSYLTIESGDEKRLQKFLASHGPIAVAVDASCSTFQTYRSGVYYDPKCTQNINHAVLLCGYGTDSKTGEEYWLVKNSYGETWGEKGYIRIKRNANNHCGISEFPVLPIC